MIELKRIELNRIYSILDNVKLNKVSDASVRSWIMKIILAGKKDLEVIKTDTEEIRAKFFDEYDQKEVAEFQLGLNTLLNLVKESKTEEANKLDEEITGKYPELLKAYKSFTDALNELQYEATKINVNPISIDAFVDAMVGQDLDITGKVLDELSPLFENEPES